MKWMDALRQTGARRWWSTWWLRGRGAPAAALTDLQRAQALVRAVDAGGLPLNPARVNAIARSLGLDVSARAPVEETIERIRRALDRAGA